ncbi:CRAL TRIO domain containing protein, partial [Asbolus verrucosus]
HCVPDEKCIQNMLIINKFKIDKTKQKLDMYYTIRTQMAHIFDFSNPNLPGMKELMDMLYFIPLPKLTTDMSRVFFFKIRNKDAFSDSDPYNGIRHLVNLQELRLHEDVAFGDIFVIDFANITMKFCLKVTPMKLFYMLKIHERFFSSRLRGSYILNAAPFVKRLFAIMKMFMKPKLFSRIKFCKDVSCLHELLPQDVIPKDYGGQGRSLHESHEVLMEKFVEYRERFDRLDQLRVDETLRPVQTQNRKIFGVSVGF